MTHLVVGRDAALLLGQEPCLLFRPRDDAHDSLFELRLLDGLLAAAGSKERGLIDEVREVGAREAWGATGERFEIDLG